MHACTAAVAGPGCVLDGSYRSCCAVLSRFYCIAIVEHLQSYTPMPPAGLLALKAVILNATNADVAAKYPSWANTSITPCHDVDPNCKLCPWELPQTTCGTQALASNATANSTSNATSSMGPPHFYCKAYGVACTDGRVTTLNISYTGLVLSQLPAGLAQLSKLQELRE